MFTKFISRLHLDQKHNFFLNKAAAAVSYCKNCTESCLNGSSVKFYGQQYFRYGVNMATCTVEKCQYKYMPKSGSDVHATRLVGRL